MFGLKTAGFAAAIAFAVAAGAPFGAEAQQRWKAQSLYGPNTTVFKDFQKFTDRVKDVTKGALLIEALPVATIVPQAEALDAVKAGLLDAASGTMAYQGGKEPAAAFWDLTAGYDNPMHLLMWYKLGGGMEIMNKIASRWDAVFLGPVILGLESIPLEEADPLDRRLQGREDALARRHPGRDLRQARRLGLGHARHRSVHRARHRQDRGDRLGHALGQ